MTTVTVKGYLYAERDECGIYVKRGDFVFAVKPYDNSTCSGAMLGPVEFRHTLPDGLNLEAACVAAKIAELEAQKAEAARKFSELVASIDARLSKLQAITNEVPA